MGNTTVTIPADQKDAAGTIRFTPIDDDESTNDLPDDDLIVTLRTIGAGDKGDGSTEIRLVDTDKPTTQINLSFSHASLSKNDPTTTIVVTATLNGGKVRKDLRFPMIIDEVATAAAGLTRDVDYSAVPSWITIPDRRVSGKGTIVFSPKNKKFGPVWVKAGGDPLTYTYEEGENTITQTVTVNPNFILLTELPSTSVEALTATPYSIREDAGSKEVTLEITLKNAVSTDETVTLTIEPTAVISSRIRGTMARRRDTRYTLCYESAVDLHPKGRDKREGDGDIHSRQQH